MAGDRWISDNRGMGVDSVRHAQSIVWERDGESFSGMSIEKGLVIFSI